MMIMCLGLVHYYLISSGRLVQSLNLFHEWVECESRILQLKITPWQQTTDSTTDPHHPLMALTSSTSSLPHASWCMPGLGLFEGCVKNFLKTLCVRVRTSPQTKKRWRGRHVGAATWKEPSPAL